MKDLGSFQRAYRMQ